MEYNYTAIVLKKKKIGETDRLYTFYTRESGKIQSVGRGIRKPKAKLSGHLETLCQSDIIIAKRHGLGNIASAIAEKYFLNIKNDEVVLHQVFDAIADFERMIEFEEKDEKLFLLLSVYLEHMNTLAADREYEKARLVTQGFLFQFLDHLGYRLEMQSCAFSGEKLSSSSKYFFGPEFGGVANVRYINQSNRAVVLSENAIKLIRIFFHNKLSSLHRVQASHKDLVCVEHVSRVFLQWISR